jgi:putative PIN family toxin of toxin-antitoxin system
MQLAFDGELDLYISSYVIAELRETATRPRVAAKLRLTADRAEEFIESVELAATLLEGVPETFTFERDPDDAHYVNLAIAANAKLIVSRDNDLLSLMDSISSESRDFQARFRSLRIITPVQLLNESRIS